MSIWPPFEFEAVHENLTLRVFRDEDAPMLVDILEDTLPEHQRAFLPVLALDRGDTRQEKIMDMLKYHWSTRLMMEENFKLEFVARVDGVVVGVQALVGKNFIATGQVATGSYLGRRFQGAGIGTRMRALVLELAFTHLGALGAASEYHPDNKASAGVSARLGYQLNGFSFTSTAGDPHQLQRVHLDRATWASSRPAWLDQARFINPTSLLVEPYADPRSAS